MVNATVAKVDIHNDDCQCCQLGDQVDGCEHFDWEIDWDGCSVVCTAVKWKEDE